MADERIVEKVRKLLALAGNNDSAEEAALATARAVELMERHAIAMADVEAGEDDVAAELVRDWFGPQLRKVASWQGYLGTVVAKGCGCSTAWIRDHRGVRLVVLGEEDDVNNAMQLRTFAHKEIDRLTAKHTQGRGRRWGVSFRMGCVTAIERAMKAERDQLRATMAGTVTETALVVMDTRKERADEALGVNDMKSAKSNRREDWDAMAEGRQAGQSIYGQSKPRVER